MVLNQQQWNRIDRNALKWSMKMNYQWAESLEDVQLPVELFLDDDVVFVGEVASLAALQLFHEDVFAVEPIHKVVVHLRLRRPAAVLLRPLLARVLNIPNRINVFMNFIIIHQVKFHFFFKAYSCIIFKSVAQHTHTMITFTMV